MSYLPMGVTQDQLDRLIENEPWGDDQDDEVDGVPEPWREDDPILMPEPVEAAPEPEFKWEEL